MRSIMSMLRMDFKLIMRDKITLYMILAPALLAFIMLAVMGDVGRQTARFAITRDLPPGITEKLERVAEIETVDDYEALTRRVMGADSVAGVYWDSEPLAILTEGNEKPGFLEKNTLLLAKALSESPVLFESVEVESTGNQVINMVFASLILLAMLIAGSVSGFNIVNERESGAIRALAVSPTHLYGYAAGRTLIALVFGVINVCLSITIMGKPMLVPQFLVIALASVFVYGLVAFLLGSFANNQISAIASMKLLMPMFLLLPITSTFVPDHLRFLYYPFPMFWQYDSVLKALEGSLDWFSPLMIFLTGLVCFLAVLTKGNKKLGVRRG